jgi:DNA repair exonuclease SbcCD ATPase subunit
MGSQLNLTILEIIVLMIGAITLGITIHFFIITRKPLDESEMATSGNTKKEVDSWRMKYYNDIDDKDQELAGLKKRLAEAEENNEINAIEAEEMRKLSKELKAELESARKTPPIAVQEEKPDYIEQLRLAQSSLLEHNDKINKLLGQISIVKDTEEKQQEILKTNEELSAQIDELQSLLSQKEKEVNSVKKKEQLSGEMTSMLDSAYNEFNVLQEKIQKLESQVTVSKKINMEHEDLKEGYYRVTKDFEEQKKKYNATVTEKKQLMEDLAETEDKLKEANYQRQQLQKRVAYLEELNNDMQAVADANKKLENQLKRIGELESMLNVVAEERDILVQRQTKTG